MSGDTKLILSEIEKVNKGLSELKNDVSGLKQDVSGLKQDVSGLKQDVSGLKQDVSRLDNRVSGVENDVSGLKQDVSGLKQGFRDLRLTLENETNRNIQFIAEGHLDLARKLDEVLRVENEKEMMLIRVTRLENEVRRLKEKNAEMVG